MKLSKRETVLLFILTIVAGTMAYYFFWFAPKLAAITGLTGSISQMKQDIEDANLRAMQYEILSKTKAESREQWDAVIDSIPPVFDEADILRRIEQYFTPFTTDITIEFPEETTKFVQTESFPVTIRCSVTYDTLVQILNDFGNDDTQLRIVNLESELISIVDDQQVSEIVILAEYLTVYSGDTPAPEQNTEQEFFLYES